jgi:uncharacterized protein
LEPNATVFPHEPSPRDVSQWRGTAHPPPWGYFATIGWTMLAFFIGAIAGVFFCGWMIGYDHLDAMAQRYATDVNVRYDGVLLSYIYIASSVVQIAIFALVIRLKPWRASEAVVSVFEAVAPLRRWSIAEYLGLVIPSQRAVFYGLSLLVLFVVVTDGATTLLGNNPVTEFQIVSYRTAKQEGALSLLLAVIILVAPIAEEIMFRGFLYRGFVRKPSHAPYAILVISLLFTIVHQQYDLIGLIQVFILALLLGWTRWWSGSTVLTIMMHVMANFIAMAETAVYIEWWQP